MTQKGALFVCVGKLGSDSISMRRRRKTHAIRLMLELETCQCE